MTHIGAVGRVGVDEEDGVPVVHQLDDGAAAGGLQLGHVAVDVKAVALGAGAYQLGRELGGYAVLVQIVVSIGVAVGDDDDDQILEEIVMLALRDFAGEDHHGFLALDLAGVYIAVYIYNALVLGHVGGGGGGYVAYYHVGYGSAGLGSEGGGVQNDAAGAVLGYYLQKINDLLRRCGAFPIALLGRGFELCQYRLGIDLLGLRLSGGRGFFGRGSGGCTGCQAKGHDQYKNERQDFFHSFVFLSFVVFL